MGDVSLYFWADEALSDDAAHDHLVIGHRVWSDIESRLFTERVGSLNVETLNAEDSPDPEPENVLMASLGEKRLYPGLPDNGAQGNGQCLVLKTKAKGARRKPAS